MTWNMTITREDVTLRWVGWEVVGKCLGRVRGVVGKCLGSAWEVVGKCLGRVRGVLGKCLGSAWEVHGGCPKGAW